VVASPDKKRFEIWLINLDPTIGHEIKKSRPCLIISPDEMNFLKTVIIAPMTTVKRNFPFRPDISFGEKAGQVALDQIRSVDKNRLIKHLGILDTSYQQQIFRTLGKIFAP